MGQLSHFGLMRNDIMLDLMDLIIILKTKHIRYPEFMKICKDAGYIEWLCKALWLALGIKHYEE